MKLYLPEKPKTAKALAKALGIPQLKVKGICYAKGDTVIIPAFGHLFELFMPEDYDPALKKWIADTLPFIPPNEFKIKLTDDPGVKRQFALIKKNYKKATQIIHAGDSDREGQYLIDEILIYLNNRKPVLRFFPKSLSKQGVLKGLQKMEDNSLFINQTYAAMARSWSDFLIGINVTRALSVTAWDAGLDDVLSGGRVQCVIIGLVVDRDRQIETFIPIDYFVPKITVGHPGGNYEATWIPTEAHPIDSENRLTAMPAAQKIITGLKGQSGKIVSVTKEIKKTPPPLLYTKAGMLQDASKRFGFGTKKTADLSQKIYEYGLITYPRTDNPHLDEADFEDGVQTLKSLASMGYASAQKADPTIKSKAWKKAKKKDNKYAIVPSGDAPKGLTGDEQKLYDMIVERYVMQFYPPKEFLSQIIVTEVGQEQWKTTGTSVIDPGWTVLQKKNSQDNTLPKVNKDDPVTCVDAKIQSKTTKPPDHFSEPELVVAMEKIHKYVPDPRIKAILRENAGIGTEGTREDRINITIERRYIERIKGPGNKVRSTQLGKFIRDSIHPSLTNPGTSAMWDEFLNLIEEGKQTKEDFIAQIKAQVPILVKETLAIKFPPELVGIIHRCPECNSRIKRYKRKKGKGFFWGCYAKEKHADGQAILFTDVHRQPGNKIVPVDVSTLPRTQCPEPGCTEQVVLMTSQKGFSYWKCSNKAHPLRFNDNGQPGKPLEFKKKRAS